MQPWSGSVDVAFWLIDRGAGTAGWSDGVPLWLNGISVWLYRISVPVISVGWVSWVWVTGVRWIGVSILWLPPWKLDRRVRWRNLLCSIVSCVVLGIVNNRGWLDCCHFIVQLSIEGFIISKHHLSDTIPNSDVEIASVQNVNQSTFSLSACRGHHYVIRPQESHPRSSARNSWWAGGTWRSRNTEWWSVGSWQ